MPAYVEDTIAAIATAEGPGAVAIIRLSGHDALEIARRVLRGRKGLPLDLSRSHRARRGTLVDADNGETLDDVLVLPMRGPRSYTGEDVVEIHCHGGFLVPRLALGLLLRAGARGARPGEFTERAFLNGRLDLCQAEAVADLIGATSQAAARRARRQIDGVLSATIADLGERVLDARAVAEAHLDFPEDDVPVESVAELRDAVDDCRHAVAQLAATYDRGRLSRDGIRIVLVGKPNVGKSSLLNAILGRDRALVSDSPGTTRDFLEEPASLGSLAALVCDTAGIRPAHDAIESAGIARTMARIEGADVAVIVLDGSQPLDELDAAVVDATAACRVRLLVRNKADLPAAWMPVEMFHRLETAGFSGRLVDEVCARDGSGVERLCRAIRDALPEAELGDLEERPMVTHERQYAALARSVDHLDAAKLELAADCRLEIVALQLQSASVALEAVLGVTTAEDVLGRVFSRFCIGK
jgi:tRNA modification GTPase